MRENLSCRKRNVNIIIKIQGIKLANFRETQLTAKLRKGKEILWREITRKKDETPKRRRNRSNCEMVCILLYHKFEQWY